MRPGGPHLRGAAQEQHVLQRALPATAASARLARVTARVACRAWRVPDAGDSAVVVASELVNLALARPAQERLTLRVLMTPRRLRLEVHAPAPPLGDGSTDDMAAHLLGALCARWGQGAGGSGVWAEIPLVDGRPRDVWETGAAARRTAEETSP